MANRSGWVALVALVALTVPAVAHAQPQSAPPPLLVGDAPAAPAAPDDDNSQRTPGRKPQDDEAAKAPRASPAERADEQEGAEPSPAPSTTRPAASRPPARGVPPPPPLDDALVEEPAEPPPPKRVVDRDAPPPEPPAPALAAWEISGLLALATAVGVFVGAMPFAFTGAAAAGYYPARNVSLGQSPFSFTVLTPDEVALQTNLPAVAGIAFLLTPAAVALAAALSTSSAAVLLGSWLHGGRSGALVFAVTLPALPLAIVGGALIGGLLAFGASALNDVIDPMTSSYITAGVLFVGWPLATALLQTVMLAGAGSLGFWSTEALLSAFGDEEDDDDRAAPYEGSDAGLARKPLRAVAFEGGTAIDAE